MEAEEANVASGDVTGRQLRMCRGMLGLTQTQLAQKLGINVTTLARWERGDAPIANPQMLSLALDELTRRVFDRPPSITRLTTRTGEDLREWTPEDPERVSMEVRAVINPGSQATCDEDEVVHAFWVVTPASLAHQLENWQYAGEGEHTAYGNLALVLSPRTIVISWWDYDAIRQCIHRAFSEDGWPRGSQGLDAYGAEPLQVSLGYDPLD